MRELSHASSFARNRLLSGLPRVELEPLLPYLQSVTFSPGESIYEPGERIDFCYFPTNSVVSLVYTMQDGSTAEMGVVGNDGVLGVALFLGCASTCSRALGLLSGNALRLPAKLLLREFKRAGSLQDLLLRYTQTLLSQISQTAVCNRLHSVEQRLCRWLLLCHDRVNSAELVMTQELIAQMLGGRRESVTVAAGHLQDAGLIHYCRGRIRILNRNGLESNACECYRVVEDELDRVLGRKRECKFSKPEAAFKAAG